MNYKAVFHYIGNILQIESLLMLPAFAIAIFRSEDASIKGFLITIPITVVVARLLLLLPKSKSLYAKEGFAIVSLGWIMMSVFGAFPYIISGVIPNVIDAFFETVSGFTTTGATILTNVEVVPHSLLYWRCFTNWLGGMGVLVFLLAVVPMNRGDGATFHIMKAESPGPSVGKMTPTIQSTSRILYGIYIAMTALLFLLLLAGGMPCFDSICAAISTAGTGGFFIKNASVGAYASTYIQGIIGLFMFLFSVNFNIYYLLLMRQFKTAAKNEELRFFVGVSTFSILAIWLSICKMYASPWKALMDSFFQVESVMSTAGFVTTDYNCWPNFAKILLVMLMFGGGCAGSTSGGIKLSRVLLLFKQLRNEMKIALNARRVSTVHMDGKPVERKVISGLYAFLLAYVFVFGLSILLISLNGFSFETTIVSVISTLNNIGPGLDVVGPTGNYSSFSAFSKIVFSLDMLIGRLEIMPMMILFSISTWRRNS